MKPYQSIRIPDKCKLMSIYLSGTFDGVMTVVFEKDRPASQKNLSSARAREEAEE